MRLFAICIFFFTVAAYKVNYLEPAPNQYDDCSIFLDHDGDSSDCRTGLSLSFLEHGPVDPGHQRSEANTKTLEDAFKAMVVLQNEFFLTERGTWPSAIDWIAAVLGTGLSAMTTTLSKALATLDFDGLNHAVANLNLIDTFFSQTIASYFGQNDVAIRGQVCNSHHDPDFPSLRYKCWHTLTQ
jgi:hypothetical protein